MAQQTVLWILLVGPWCTLFLMKKDAMKRYMPGALFVTILEMLIFQVAYTYHWWSFPPIVRWGNVIDLSYVFGPFIVGALWILHFSFQKFWFYTGLNVAVDLLFSYVLSPIFRQWGLQTIYIPKWQVFLLMIGKAFLMYLYQRWQEGIYEKTGPRDPKPTKMEPRVGSGGRIGGAFHERAR